VDKVDDLFKPMSGVIVHGGRMRSDTQNWIALAEYDLETARHMLATGRYLYVVFMSHLALEKILKAHVTEVTQSIPAKSHDLIYLLKKAELDLPLPYLDFIGIINSASIPTRYPEDLQRALHEYPEPIAREYLQRTQETLQWLKQALMSRE
jgi:HEPN domain-containing protein